MSSIQENNYAQIKLFIERSEWAYSDKMEGANNRLDVQHGKSKCVVKVYSTGTIQVQGGDSKLKEALEKAKFSIENEEAIGEILPFEIERFPEILQEKIPTIDPIIIK